MLCSFEQLVSDDTVRLMASCLIGYELLLSLLSFLLPLCGGQNDKSRENAGSETCKLGCLSPDNTSQPYPSLGQAAVISNFSDLLLFSWKMKFWNEATSRKNLW